MARNKKNSSGEAALLIFLAMLILSVFTINSVIVFYYNAHKYRMRQASQRVSDPWNIGRFWGYIIGLAAFAVILGFVGGGALNNEHPSGGAIFLAILCFGAIFMLALALSARIGTCQVGMLVFEREGYFVIPTDPTQFTLTQDVLQARAFTSMFEMEILPLDGLRRITREYGKKAFLHGTFGTRTVNWRNKRMRDECISALQMATGRKLSSIDLGL